MVGLGYILTLIDLLLRTSRVHDLFAPGLHLPLILMCFGLGVLILSARLFHFLFAGTGRLLALLTTWALLSVGVSVWPGGAYDYLMDSWIPALPPFVMVCAFVRTYRQLRIAITTITFGFVTVAIFATIFSREIGFGRLGVAQFAFGDANELAMIMLFTFPLVVWVLKDKRASWGLKAYLAAGALLGIPVLFRTGSRAGMLTLAMLMVYVLYRQSMAVRLRLILAACLALPVGIALTPKVVRDRYLTTFSSFGRVSDPIANPNSGNDDVNVEAVMSAQASTSHRLELLKRSLTVTLMNPVLGVGPGMFMVAENEMAVESGRRRGFWLASHNMYTQVSAELGIPGLIVFLMILYRIWRIFGAGERMRGAGMSFAPDLRRLSFALKLCALVILSSGATLSIGYGPFVPLLSGLAVVIERLLASDGYRRLAVQGDDAQASDSAAAPEPELAYRNTALPRVWPSHT